MRHFARRMLLGAALAAAGGVACAAEIVAPAAVDEAPPVEISISDEATAGESALSAQPSSAAHPVANTVIQGLRPVQPKNPLERSPNALLRELYLVDKQAGLDAFLAEMRGQALSALHPAAIPAEVRAGCAGGRGCSAGSAADRPERSVEDRELLATLADFRADVRDFVSPLQSIYQDSGLKTLLEVARSDDLIFGHGRSSADAMQDRSGASEGLGDIRGPASRRRESSDEVLALIHFIGDFWQIMRDFGIPLLLVLIMVRGAFWVAKARRA